MAIISIPTSIGGVSIPGSSVNGPLGALFGNNFGRTDLQYPRDLQSATRGHVVKFDIQEIQPASYSEISNKLAGAAKSAVSAAGAAATEVFSNPSGALDKATDSISNFIQDPSSITKSLEFSQPKTKSVGSISLYIPETVNFTYNASYENLSAVAAAGQIPIVGTAVKAVAQVLDSGPAKLLMRGQGYAFNPQQQVMFDGIDFRTYQMSFTFTPYSKDEAQMVSNIIKMFKTHAAPRLATGTAGMFFVPPSIFVPTFYFNGVENTRISKVTKSVITSCDVNYAPSGYATYGDGSPVQTVLTLDFKEIELITRDKIQNGY